MFDKISHMIGDKNPSYKDRLQSIDMFFRKHSLYGELWPKQKDEPLSIVWAISTSFPEIFMQQLGSMVQMDNIFNPEDELILVADVERKPDVLSSRFMTKTQKSKGIIVERPFPGEGPCLNWEVGLNYATHDRVMFVRDLGLFFNPWDTLKLAREVSTQGTLSNFSVVLGPVWSRFVDRWMYLVHPRFAPNPFLFCFVASKKDIETMGGFDPRLSRGYDHTGELDFLLRWNMAGFAYEMSEDPHIFHLGIGASSQEELQMMQFESSVNRRYFFDRYGEQLIMGLQPPYKADVNMVEVNHALTYDPLSEVLLGDEAFEKMKPVQDAFTFNKWPLERMVKEIV